MRIEQFHYFIETARQRSIHKASDKLHISHQSLNASLKSLETELGTVLFERGTQGVTLTYAGEIMLQYTTEVVNLTTKLHLDLASLESSTDQSITGNLQCMVSPHLTIQILPQLIKTFAQSYPEVTLNIKERDSILIAQRFNQGYDGLALFTHYENTPNILPFSDDLIIQQLFSEVDDIVVSPTHPLAKYKPVSIKTLLKYPIALYQNSDEETCILLEILKELGTPCIYMVSDNVSILEDAVISGHAITFAPQRALKHHTVFSKTNQIAVLKIRNYPHIIISSIVNKSYYQTHQHLIDLFLETLKTIW